MMGAEMTKPLVRLTYVSRSLIPACSVEMLEIVRTSLRNNERDAITGALWFDGTVFFQVLEGAAGAVAARLERIVADRRHADIRSHGMHEVDTRSFAGWSMKFVDGTAPHRRRRPFCYDTLMGANPDVLAERVDELATI